MSEPKFHLRLSTLNFWNSAMIFSSFISLYSIYFLNPRFSPPYRMGSLQWRYGIVWPSRKRSVYFLLTFCILYLWQWPVAKRPVGIVVSCRIAYYTTDTNSESDADCESDANCEADIPSASFVGPGCFISPRTVISVGLSSIYHLEKHPIETNPLSLKITLFSILLRYVSMNMDWKYFYKLWKIP